jgi:small-conductance mechanosensitive channel
VFEDENRNWEAELHQRLGELLANRLNPLKSELEQLQATFSAVSNRLLEQTQFAPTAAETASLTAQVSEWLQTEAVKTEQNFQSRLEIELASAREQLETELQQRLEAKHLCNPT